MRKKVAIFASGSGSNAEQIIQFSLRKDASFEVGLIVSNNKDAYVLSRAKNNSIPSVVCSKAQLNSNQFINTLNQHTIDAVVLAGFLLLIPDNLIRAYPNKIVNIHPSLLPKYGGKGMYGSNIHQAVHTNNESFSGMTIHLVNEKYDDGKILYQAVMPLENEDTPTTIASKVLTLEHAYYARVINEWLAE